VSFGESRSVGREVAGSPREGMAFAPAPAHAPPRLVVSRGAAAPAGDPAGAASRAPAAPPPALTVTPAERDEVLELALGADDAAVGAFVDRLIRQGVGVGAIYMELLAPTAEALGRMWDDDTCDFLDVTLATGRLQRVVRELGHGFVGAAPASEVAGRVLLSAIPGEQHTLGLFIVAEYLLRDGWAVRVLTPDTSADLGAVMRDEWFDVVGFSAACDTRLLALRHEIAAVRRHSRNRAVCALVGGRIFIEHPDLVGRVGADGFAASAADAPGCARALVAARPG